MTDCCRARASRDRPLQSGDRAFQLGRSSRDGSHNPACGRATTSRNASWHTSSAILPLQWRLCGICCISSANRAATVSDTQAGRYSPALARLIVTARRPTVTARRPTVAARPLLARRTVTARPPTVTARPLFTRHATRDRRATYRTARRPSEVTFEWFETPTPYDIYAPCHAISAGEPRVLRRGLGDSALIVPREASFT